MSSAEPNPSLHPKQTPRSRGLRLCLFGRTCHVVWGMTFVLALAFELVPNPGVAPIYFYLMVGAKLMLIFLLGFTAPLALWRFNSLSWGVLWAIIANAFAEAVQFLSHGHRSSWLEWGFKLLLLLAGFAAGLDVRDDRELRLGRIVISFSIPTNISISTERRSR